MGALPPGAGTRVALRETSNYPWSGDIRIAVDPETPAKFDVKVRVPGWCAGATVAVNGSVVAIEPVNGYVTINREWRKGDVVTLDLPMPAVRLYANPAVIMDAGRVALKRGPLVYCIEEADNPGGRVQRLRLPREAELKVSARADLFGGAVTLTSDAIAVDEGEFTSLYRTEPPVEQASVLTAIPYYLWANRGQGSMVVWMPEA